MKKNKAIASPYIVWMIAFTVIPLLFVVYYAFTGKDEGFTLNNITGLGRYASVFFFSLLLAVIATVICLVVAYPVSFFLSRMRAGRQGVMLMLVMLPMWINFLLRTYAWLTLLERNGLINRFLGLFGIGPFEMANTPGAVILGMVYNYLPYMILPLYTAMLKIHNSIIEAAEDLGAGRLHTVLRVILPLSRPGINTGLTMVFVPCISTFAISNLMSGGNVWLIGNLVESQFLGSSPNFHVGSALSVVLMVVVLLCMSFTSGFDSEDIEGVV